MELTLRGGHCPIVRILEKGFLQTSALKIYLSRERVFHLFTGKIGFTLYTYFAMATMSWIDGDFSFRQPSLQFYLSGKIFTCPRQADSFTQNPGSSAYTLHCVFYTWDELIMSISQVGNILDFVALFIVRNLLESRRLWSQLEEVGFCVYRPPSVNVRKSRRANLSSKIPPLSIY